MAFEPFDSDLKQLDRFVVRILEAYKDGKISQDKAVELVERAVIAAAMDDQGEFKVAIWLGPES